MAGLLAHSVGVDPATGEELVRNGITSQYDFLAYKIESLAEKISGVSRDALAGSQRRLIDRHAPPAVMAADILAKEEAEECTIQSQTQVDDLLEGGVRTGEILEVVGRSRTGKTALALRLSAGFVRMHDGNALYIDTHGNFTAARVRRAFQGMYGPLPPSVEGAHLQRIRVLHATDIVAVVRALDDLARCLERPGHDDWRQYVGLVVIDNPALHLLPILSRGSQAGQMWMLLLGRVARRLATHNVCVVITNIMVAGEPGGPMKPALGGTFPTIAHHRLVLSETNEAGAAAHDVRAVLDRSYRCRFPAAALIRV